MTLFQNLILFTNHYGNLQEMLEMASFLKYVDFYLTSEWGQFYVGHPVVWYQTYGYNGTVSDNDLKKLGLGSAATKLLCATVPRDGCHVVCIDRFFTSVKCAEYLLKNNIHQTILL
jgi:hypothetical protein